MKAPLPKLARRLVLTIGAYRDLLAHQAHPPRDIAQARADLFEFDSVVDDRIDLGIFGLGFVRVPSVGVHPQFVKMIAELLQERIEQLDTRPAVGRLGPSHDICPVDCCLYPRPSPGARPTSTR